MMNDRWIQGYVGVLTGQIVIVGFGGLRRAVNSLMVCTVCALSTNFPLLCAH